MKYYLNQGLFYSLVLISHLPIKLLYGLSNFANFINWHLVGYRKKVVLENLKNAFPDKNDSELLALQRQYFVNFFDYVVESLMLFSITKDQLRQRMQHLNQDLFYKAWAQNRNVVLLAGHVFNWEWIAGLSPSLPQQHCYPVYKKVNEPYWDQKVRLMRQRFGNFPLERKEILKQMLSDPQNGNQVYMFVADQTPHHTEIRLWMDFLNQKTPVFDGYDKIAKKRNICYLYCEITKIKRGYYQVVYREISPDGEKFTEQEIVQKFHHLLENNIKNDPANWLWSHKKWKYSHLYPKP
jgi:Kdo2-lipid IVA lauroyltransferase/acyltransferase